MPKKLKKKASSSSPFPMKVMVSDCVEIVLVDSSKLRKSICSQYRKAEAKLEKARNEIVVYETEDLSAFARWRDKNFAHLLASIQTHSEKLQAQYMLLDSVTMEVYLTKCSPSEAYARVMAGTNRKVTEQEKTKAEGKRGPFDANDQFGWGHDFGGDDQPQAKVFGDTHLPPDFDVERYDNLSKMEQMRWRELYEEKASNFRRKYGQHPPTFDSLLEDERANLAFMHGSKDIPASAQQLKTLYRRLVRLLHPDGNADHGSLERDLWHDLQEAYESGDLSRVEAIAARYDLSVADKADYVPLATIRDAIRDILSAVQQTSLHLRRLKKQPAWKFSSRKESDLKTLAAEMRLDLQQQEEAVVFELALITNDIAEYIAVAPSKAPPQPKATKSAKNATKSHAQAGQGDFFSFW